MFKKLILALSLIGCLLAISTPDVSKPLEVIDKMEAQDMMTGV